MGLNRHRALSSYFGMIFSENRFTLCANAALRVRIMPLVTELLAQDAFLEAVAGIEQ